MKTWIEIMCCFGSLFVVHDNYEHLETSSIRHMLIFYVELNVAMHETYLIICSPMFLNNKCLKLFSLYHDIRISRNLQFKTFIYSLVVTCWRYFLFSFVAKIKLLYFIGAFYTRNLFVYGFVIKKNPCRSWNTAPTYLLIVY